MVHDAPTDAAREFYRGKAHGVSAKDRGLDSRLGRRDRQRHPTVSLSKRPR